MADRRLIPDGIRDASTEALNELIDRLGTIDLTPLLIYLIDNVTATALPHLAEQFHVTGLEGWELAETEEEKRSLIKRAIELHRYKGTPWAVKEAIKAVGYYNAEIIERLPYVKYDGQHYYSGTEDYGGGARWAMFRVLIDIGEKKRLTHSDIEKLIWLINEYKNVRSHLKDVSFRSTLTDSISLSERQITKVLPRYEDIKPWGIRYDGTIRHNQAQERLYNGALLYNGSTKYDRWSVTGIRYNNEWDRLNAGLRNTLRDEVKIEARYDGRLRYYGFSYGADAPYAVDSSMPMTITKHIRHDGRYKYGGIYYNGTLKHNGSKSYFGGIYYRGNIKTEVVV